MELRNYEIRKEGISLNVCVHVGGRRRMIRVSFIVYIVSLVKLRKPEYPNITGDVHSIPARIHFIWADYSELISFFFSLRSEVGAGLG